MTRDRGAEPHRQRATDRALKAMMTAFYPGRPYTRTVNCMVANGKILAAIPDHVDDIF
jgi:hypothetical protein